jgi:hypothetical protein
METDNVHVIGDSHDECQDYSLSGEINPHLSYAIVTDGCSSSHDISRSVDVGSRIVAHAAKLSLMEQFEFFDGPFSDITDFAFIGEQIKRRVIDYIILHKNLLKLDDYYADCTLLIALMDIFGNSVVFYSGDGAFVFKLEDCLYINRIEYSHNAPYYISYSTDLDRESAYMKQFNNQIMSLTCDYFRYKKDDNVCEFMPGTKQERQVSDISNMNNSGLMKNVDIVSVLSDGYASFINGDLMDSVTSLIEFNSFKHLRGQFVTRRVMAAMKNFKKNNFKNYDDFSMAAIAKS